MEKKYLVTTMGAYGWFDDREEMEDYVNTIKLEYLDATEITHILSAEDIPVESVISNDFKLELSQQIRSIKNELSKITQEEYQDMPDSVKKFIKNVGVIVNPKPKQPKGTVTGG